MKKPVNLSTKCATFIACLCGVISSFAPGAAVDFVEANRGAVCTHDIECDDGLPCTIDTCDFPSSGPWGAGVCEHAAVADGQAGGIGGPECAQEIGLLCGGCDDGLFCNGAETCQGGVCAVGSPPCSGGQVCSESLDLCQPGPCSAQKTCIGGPTPGAACSANNGCGSGGLCRFADCEDGLRCNGEETCVAGVCQAGENPCGYGATCGERQCSVGGTIDVCITDEDCAAGLGTCSLLGPVCKYGRCCRTSSFGTPGEPACERRLKNGICSGATPNTNSGSACTVNSDCNGNNCFQFAGSCTGVGGLFYPGDVPLSPIPSGGGIVCPVINDIELRCPKYGGGITPHGNVTGYAGAVSESIVVNPSVGTPINKLGDDYQFTNTGVCVGGPRNGLGCAINSECPNGGVCNLAGPSVMSVYYIRALIGFSSIHTRAIVEFRDTAGRFVADSYAERNTVAGLERFFLDPPLIVPSEGFVVVRIAASYNPNDSFVWAGTEAVDVGSNDPNVLWVNDGPVANFLAPNPGILAFEIEGEKVAAPLGACCDISGAGCTDGVLPWVCEGDGNAFQGVGTTCPDPSCDTGACCNPATGSCTIVTPADCATAGGEFQGFGTDCDADHGYDSAQQHCCTTPATGADRCEDAAVHMITVPLPGEPPAVVTITGDNSLATYQNGDFCCPPNAECPPDFGWWEAFEIDKEAYLRIDFCCSEPERRLFYRSLYASCPCSQEISAAANPYRFPEPEVGRGEPYCADGNSWTNFGPLPAGRYYYRVFSTKFGTHGPYTMHITVDPIAVAACCVVDQCTDGVTQLQCDALGGTFLGPPNRSPAVSACTGVNGQPDSTCYEGSCCTGPGECNDVQLGQPVHKSICDSQGGSFTGGVRCEGGSCEDNPVESCSVNADCPGNDQCLGNAQQLAYPGPCPLCSIEGSGNCQAFDNSLNFTLSDRHLGFYGQLSADDFRPAGGVLDRICVWGFYLNTDPDATVSDCGPAVTQDHFRVRIFANDPGTGRSPGALIGTSTAAAQKGILPNTVCQTRLLTDVYGYELVLDDPIVGLAVGAVYWMEVSNDVCDGNPACLATAQSTCNWFWNQRAPNPYSYSFNGNEQGYPETHATPFDNVFCLNTSFSPIANEALQGACCTCDGNCALKTLFDCDNANGVWHATADTCSGVACPSGPPPNDNCIDGPPIITAGTYTVSNQCATTDGYGPFSSDFFCCLIIDFDLWYYFIAPSYCDLVVSACQTGLRFDSAIAVYHNPDNPSECPPCPFDATTSADHLAGVAQDESCLGVALGGAGYWRASEQILRDALPGECFLIRAGSFPGNRGTAILDISCPGKSPDPGPVEPQSNAVCTGAGIPYPCCSGIGVGTCNKSRFISFTHSSYPFATALRVKLTSLHHVVPPYSGGASIPFTAFEGQSLFVGPPVIYQESTASPTPFRASTLQCTPYYQDWSTVGLLHVTGPAIVPSSIYHVEYLAPSCMGVEGSPACQSGGANVSAQATLRTTRWGDIETPYNPPNATAQPDVGDIAALVSKFRSAPGAPTKARALLAGVDQFGNVNMAVDIDFSHIAACVDAFRGKPYPYTIPACP